MTAIQRLLALISDKRVDAPEAVHTYECPVWRVGKKYGPCSCGAQQLDESIDAALTELGVPTQPRYY